MKFFRFLPVCLQASLIMGCLGFLAGAHGANTKPNAKPASPSSTTNSVPLEVPIPQSVFEFDGKGVKDPFFPLSTRSPHLTTQATIVPAFRVDYFKLKGMSGSAENSLALINNRTMAAGETAEVTTPAGKSKVHCLEIKKSSVIIRVEGQFEPIEVFLPKSDQ